MGQPNETQLIINGIPCQGLVDTGSQVTTISEYFVKQHLPDVEVFPLNDLIQVTGAADTVVPYHGFVEVDITIPDGESGLQQNHNILALVVYDTEYNRTVPMVVGTNLIRLCRESCEEVYGTRFMQKAAFTNAWRLAFQAMKIKESFCKDGKLGTVVLTAKQKVVIPPRTTTTVWGQIGSIPHGIKLSALTESVLDSGLPGNICLNPRVVSVTSESTTIPVQVSNISECPITLPPKVRLCELHMDDWVRHPAQCFPEIASSSECQSSEYPKHLFDLGSADLTDGQREEVDTMLAKWNCVVSQHKNDLGNVTAVEHEINLDDNTPFKEKFRRIPPAMYEEVREHLQDMLACGAIQESKSPWASPVVIVRKKDGSLRFCIDLRRLNSRTIKDAYPLPRVEETLDALHGATWFSSLDLKSGYWQIPIAERDREKTSFTVGPLGFYECRRMPFGCSNAPSTFQRLMEHCMGDLNLRQCLIYLDDIIVFSKTFQEHLQRLESVFSRLKEYGLKLKASKCHLFQRKVKYLGHLVSSDGIEADPDKIETIKTWPVPKNLQELKSFLGFAGYYQRFVSGYSTIAKPLHELTGGQPRKKKGTSSGDKPKKMVPPVWNWTRECQQSFEALKEKLSSPPILAFADFSQPFELHIDASLTALGAALYQRSKDNKLHVIAYASRGLSKTEQRYPAHKLEFLALKWAVTDKYHDYLYGRPFKVFTDNNPVTYVMSTAKLDATGHRWLAALSAFDFKIYYTPGNQNHDADGLSRRPPGTEDGRTEISIESIKAINQYHGVDLSYEAADQNWVPLVKVASMGIQAVPPELHISPPLPGTDTLPPVSLNEWRISQERDPIIGVVLRLVESNSRPPEKERRTYPLLVKLLLREWDKLCIRQNLLYRKRTHSDGKIKYQLVLPTEYVQRALVGLHDQTGHLGRDRTLELVRSRFYWPKMADEVDQWIRQCECCTRRKVPPLAHQVASLVTIETS